MLLPEGFTKTAGILKSISRIFEKPYGATGSAYPLKESLNLSIRIKGVDYGYGQKD